MTFTRLLAFSILFFFTSCIYTEEIMPATIVNLKLSGIENCSNIELDIENGIVHNKGACVFELNFNRCRGGKTLLFGSVIKNLSPEYINDVRLKVDGIEILKTNYNEIINLKVEEIDTTKLYQLNLNL